MGVGAGRHRFQDLLLTGHPERETRRIVKAFGVPP